MTQISHLQVKRASKNCHKEEKFEVTRQEINSCWIPWTLPKTQQNEDVAKFAGLQFGNKKDILVGIRGNVSTPIPDEGV